jgi:hypothetical protein
MANRFLGTLKMVFVDLFLRLELEDTKPSRMILSRGFVAPIKTRDFQRDSESLVDDLVWDKII